VTYGTIFIICYYVFWLIVWLFCLCNYFASKAAFTTTIRQHCGLTKWWTVCYGNTLLLQQSHCSDAPPWYLQPSLDQFFYNTVICLIVTDAIIFYTTCSWFLCQKHNFSTTNSLGKLLILPSHTDLLYLVFVLFGFIFSCIFVVSYLLCEMI